MNNYGVDGFVMEIMLLKRSMGSSSEKCSLGGTIRMNTEEWRSVSIQVPTFYRKWVTVGTRNDTCLKI